MNNTGVVLSVALAHFVLAIVLGGVLFAEYHKRGKKFRSGILGYGVFLIVIFVFYSFGVYRNLVDASVLVNWVCLFLAFLANVLFVLISLKYLKNINKILFFSILPFSLGIIVIEILRILHPDKFFEIYTGFTTIIATIFAYFLIVGFLINTSKQVVDNK